MEKRGVIHPSVTPGGEKQAADKRAEILRLTADDFLARAQEVLLQTHRTFQAMKEASERIAGRKPQDR